MSKTKVIEIFERAQMVVQIGTDTKGRVVTVTHSVDDLRTVNDKGCEGCKYEGGTAERNPCFSCSNYYQNYWTAKDDKIEVGDEVNLSSDCFIVTRIFQPRNMKEQCDGIDDDGYTYHGVLMDDLEKTGRHFDIASILEAMKE